MTIALSKFTLLLALSSLSSSSCTVYDGYHQRQETPRLRAKASFNNLQGTVRAFQPLQDSPNILDADETDADSELINFFTLDDLMSMPTIEPSAEPSSLPSDLPSLAPSAKPSGMPSSAPTMKPSTTPSMRPTTFTPAPTVSMQPSVAPSVSQAPSPSLPVPTVSPSATPSSVPTASPSVSPTATRSNSPTREFLAILPTISPSASPSVRPTIAPSGSPSSKPTGAPSAAPSDEPSLEPSSSPTRLPSSVPSSNPTPVPTVDGCTVSAVVREQQILALLDSVADPALIRNTTSPQGQATGWLLNQDSRTLCPDDPKILQRWVLAVTYFSTGGDSWLQCSDRIFADDLCGVEEPFEGKQRFLSGFSECDWAGIECETDENGNFCVTEIEFEDNDLIGTIPTEIGLLTDLKRWGMERGELSGTIPTEIESLSSLVFLDFDYNELTGTLTTQLLSLTQLTQLDLNNNQLTGSIDGVDVFPDMVFLQLHDNNFSGTIPDGIGTFAKLEVFTVHETDISGVMPQSVCDLFGDGLPFESLIADCGGDNPDIECSCCTDCREG